MIAIDGGGTRCRVACCDGSHVVSVETGPANVSSDFTGAVSEITNGLHALADRMGCPVAALWDLPTFAGIAGVTGPAIAQRLRRALPFRTLQIADDRHAALRGALGARDGMLAHCGTGSFFAAQRGQKAQFCGGWGHVLGDEASACWVGKQALKHTVNAVDGHSVTSALTDHMLAKFDGAPGIIRFAATAQPAAFGALAPIVTDHGTRKDACADMILHRGADHIARALRQLGWQPGLPVCLTGGIGPTYGPYLPQELRAVLTQPLGNPLAGAIALARALDPA